MPGSKLGPLINVCCDVTDNCRPQLQGRTPHKKDNLGNIYLKIKYVYSTGRGPGDRMQVGTFRTCSDEPWGFLIILSIYWVPGLFPGVKSVGA